MEISGLTKVMPNGAVFTECQICLKQVQRFTITASIKYSKFSYSCGCKSVHVPNKKTRWTDPDGFELH